VTQVDPDMSFSNIIVPTSDTISYSFIIDRLVLHGSHVLCVGETGTGKTVTVQEKLNNGLPDNILPVFMTFSARTSANQTQVLTLGFGFEMEHPTCRERMGLPTLRAPPEPILFPPRVSASAAAAFQTLPSTLLDAWAWCAQDLIDSKMDKRRKGVFGPPSGKRMIIALDDMNMPLREKYFAQPPIEILRQWMDHKGWYERKPPCAFRQLVDVQYIGCMGPPGGGRNPVSNRFLRHFNFVAFAEMSDSSVCRIFDMILTATLERKFAAEVVAMSTPMVAATVEMYNQIRLGMLPTPAKSHYTFNLRDLARVIQGVLRAEPKEVRIIKKGERRGLNPRMMESQSMCSAPAARQLAGANAGA
jgi:hypothetical protein